MAYASNDGPLERFIAQFEWDGAYAIYRSDRTGPAYRVTGDEYHQFVDSFERRGKRLNWTMAVIWLLMLAILVFVPPFCDFFPNSWLGKHLPWAVLLPAWTSSWLANRWSFLAPARALRQRTPAAAALSKEERLQITVGEQSWLTLLTTAACFGALFVFVIIVFSPFRERQDLFPWLILAGSGAFLAFYLLRMMRKWLLERRLNIADHAASNLI